MPQPPEQPRNNKNLIIVLGAVAAAVIIALVAVFVWVIPAFSKPQAEDNPVPVAPSSEAAASEAAEESAAPEGSAAPSEDASSDDMPAGAFPLPQGWDELQGPANIPAADDPLFKRFVTGESSFSYLAAWSSDETFGITTDPATGAPMQQVAKGTDERDGDGISTAFSFFAEAEEGKYGKEPAKVQAAIKDIEAKLKAIPAAELPQHLVGHKCVSNFAVVDAGNPGVPPCGGRRGRVHVHQRRRRRHPGRQPVQRDSVGHPADDGRQRTRELLERQPGSVGEDRQLLPGQPLEAGRLVPPASCPGTVPDGRDGRG